MSDKSTLPSVGVPDGSFIVSEWLDWNFSVNSNPFDETANENGLIIEEAVKQKQDNIENHVRQELISRGGEQWTVNFVWTVLDTLPIVFNMKATISKPGLVGGSTTLGARGSVTPPPPPQPPPPSL